MFLATREVYHLPDKIMVKMSCLQHGLEKRFLNITLSGSFWIILPLLNIKKNLDKKTSLIMKFTIETFENIS